MAEIAVQPSAFLLEMSADWLILQATENTRRFLGDYHATLVGEPLADFAMAQPLHDLRNSLARQRSSTGIAYAYRVKLVDDPRLFDVAFQQIGDRILLEGVESGDDGFGSALGSVSRMIDGLEGDGPILLENAARRLRALTGFDRAAIILDGGDAVESSRGNMPPVMLSGTDSLPPIVVDASAQPVALFPRQAKSSTAGSALLRAPTRQQSQELRDQGICSLLNVPLYRSGEAVGCIRCDHRSLGRPSFELHAAVGLFAQVMMIRLGC